MSLKLSQQLDADANAAFALYESYLNNKRRFFPKSVLDLMNNDDWHGGCYSKSPHDASLATVQIRTEDAGQKNIILELFKASIELKIKIEYIDVFHFDFPTQDLFFDPIEWRFEQFTHVDAYENYEIKGQKIFKHEIEWRSGIIWSITASEIKVSWTG